MWEKEENVISAPGAPVNPRASGFSLTGTLSGGTRQDAEVSGPHISWCRIRAGQKNKVSNEDFLRVPSRPSSE